MMTTEQRLALVIQAMEDRKASNIRVLDVRGISSITDLMVIACGNSDRQIAAIARNVVEEAKHHGLQPLGVEGENSGEWVLVDLDDVVAHVMLPQIRDFYQLEKLWGELGGHTALAA